MVEPACRRESVAKLNGFLAKFRPPYIARTAPVLGSIATSEACGSFGALRTSSAARLAWACMVRSMVVVTRKPSWARRVGPYLSSRYCRTFSRKYGAFELGMPDGRTVKRSFYRPATPFRADQAGPGQAR